MKILNKFFKLAIILATSAAILTGCDSANSTSVMKSLTIDNDIAFDYVISSALSTATGFASDIAVISSEDEIKQDSNLTAKAALLVDITDNKVLYQKNPHLRLYPASTTKIMTGLVALKYGDIGKTYTIEDQLKIEEDNVWTLDLRVGDKLTLEQVLYGAIVASGNDAAYEVALMVAGSQEAFASLMNKEAQEIGATNSHFVNPHGLTNTEHYTTAYDLYLIFNEAIKNKTFLQMCSTKEYTTAFQRSKYTITPKWTNGNYFINGNVTAPEGITVIGGKTGYTEAAGNCLVILSECSSNGHKYISVILNTQSKNVLYSEMSYLLEQIPHK